MTHRWQGMTNAEHLADCERLERERKRRECPCGSGKESWWEYDARGIALCRVCETCRKAKLARYRPDVFTNPQYWADEPIEGDD